MTEKRFKIFIGEFEEENIIDTVKKIEITKISDMCIQMNTLYDENEQLKNHIQELQNHLKRLENENIQTYTLIKEAYNNERTELGKSVLKQLIEAIQ